VVSGADYGAVDRTALRLKKTFEAETAFDSVFAPALDPFLRDHRAYFLEPERLEDWISGVQYDYGAMLRLADSAGLANAAITLADQISATDGLRLPSALRSLAESFAQGVPEALSLEAYPHLVPDSDRHYVVLIVKGIQRLDQRLPNESQVRLIREGIAGTRVDDGVEVRLTGEVPLAHEEISTALDGIGIAGTISLVLLAVILHFGVGSWRIISATFALLGIGVIWTMAFAIVSVGSFNTLALIFVVMFFGLGVDFSVHFSLRLQEDMSAGGTEDVEVHAVREVGPALVLCMLTSSIAFLSFLPTAYLGLGELGIISAGGMLIALVLTLTLLPAFFSLTGLPLPPPVRSARSFPALTLRPGMVLLVASFVAAIAFWVARDLSFDYSVLALRDETTEAMSALLELQDNEISTDYSIQMLVEDEASVPVLVERLKELPEVGAVMAPADLLPSRQADKSAKLSELHALLENLGPILSAETQTAAADLMAALQYVDEVLSESGASVAREDEALVANFFQVLRGLQGEAAEIERLNDALAGELAAELSELLRITGAESFGFEDLPVDLRRRFVTEDGQQLVTVMPAAALETRNDMDAFVQSVMSVDPGIGGRAVVEWGVGGVAVQSFVEAVTLAISIIAVLLVLYFRGLVLPLVVLLPLGLTTVITFAIVQLTGLTLNMANILVVPLIFGLGVDTGIHVVHRFNAAKDESRVLSSSTTRAVIISALTTVGTFFSLSFSPHKGAASVGLLLTIAISTMLVVTLLVVPALLRLLPGRAGAH
jgi:hopanoid biosynthesis associated RND transporter like protein HpnN